MRVSPNQLGIYKACNEKWRLLYVEQLRPERASKKHLDIGLYTHQILHYYYQLLKSGYKAGDPFVIDAMEHKLRQDAREDVTPENVDVMSIAIPLVTKFVKHQSPIIDSGIEVLLVEHEFRVDYKDITLHGFIDLVYKDRSGSIRIRDHKTAANIGSWFQAKLIMNEQLLLYLAAMSSELGEPVLKAEISVLCSAKGKQPMEKMFKRLSHYHTEQSIQSWLDNLEETHKQMMNPHQIRNYSELCAGCQFLDICHAGTRGNSTSELRNKMHPVDIQAEKVVE